MTTENRGVNWTIYRAKLLNLPRHPFQYTDRPLARIRGARVRLPFAAVEQL